MRPDVVVHLLYGHEVTLAFVDMDGEQRLRATVKDPDVLTGDPPIINVDMGQAEDTYKVESIDWECNCGDQGATLTEEITHAVEEAEMAISLPIELQ